MATSEALRGAAAVAEPHQVVAATTVVMTTTVTAPSISLAPAPVSGGGGRPRRRHPTTRMGPVGEPARTSPELPVGALVVRDDGCVMSGHPTNGAEASSLRAVLPASDGATARLEQELERAIMPPAHFADTQAEQELWQEFRDHDASLNRALNEALKGSRQYGLEGGGE
jgi:hypothetical protein